MIYRYTQIYYKFKAIKYTDPIHKSSKTSKVKLYCLGMHIQTVKP